MQDSKAVQSREILNEMCKMNVREGVEREDYGCKEANWRLTLYLKRIRFYCSRKHPRRNPVHKVNVVGKSLRETVFLHFEY